MSVICTKVGQTIIQLEFFFFFFFPHPYKRYYYPIYQTVNPVSTTILIIFWNVDIFTIIKLIKMFCNDV